MAGITNVPGAHEPAKPAPVRRSRDVPVPDGFDMPAYLSGVGALMAGSANVIMQLSWPGVGYGVMNSRVHDGSAMLHPVKRARTTFTYIAVAILGTDDERAAYRKAVNGQHAQVVSQPDEPVEYRAMDPRLQTWVAVCLYYGTRDVVEKLRGPLDDATADALYAHCARLGTTLQMPAEAWPATRDDFDVYWDEALAEVRIDPPVRDYLLKLTRLQNLPPPLRWLGPVNVFVTTGFLPPTFREAMGLRWSTARQRRFDRLLHLVGRVESALPGPIQNFPFNVLLRDLRRRIRRGRPLL